MSELALIAGTALQCALGIALVLALPRRAPLLPQPGGLAWIIGTGALAGSFLLTLLMRALAFAGIPFGIATIGVPMALLTLVLAWIGWRREGPGGRAALAGSARTVAALDLRGAARIVWWLVLGWLSLRFALLLVEVLVRPLYPWDAWTQWATKARVWFELKTIAPFVKPEV